MKIPVSPTPSPTPEGSNSHVETYRILILGGSSSGTDNLSNLSPTSPLSTIFRRFAAASHSTVLCLQTPVSGPLSHDDAAAMARWGIDAVNLASPQTMAHGSDGLESTLGVLESVGIQYFGAGKKLNEAQAPHRIILPERLGGGEIHLHGSLHHQARKKTTPQVHAGPDAPGCAPLAISSSPLARNDSSPADSLQVALPTWGAVGRWRTQRQFALAHRLLAKGYDLILGQGTGSLREIHRKQQRWVAYGVGNGLSDASTAEHRDQTTDLPFSLWTMLEVHRQDHRRWVEVKLYPVSTVGTDPGPVTGEEFDRVVSTLASRPERPWRFRNPAMTTGADHLGHFIALEVGDWAFGEPPTRLAPTLENKDAGDWPLRSPSVAFEDKIFELNKQLGAAMLAVAAEADGGTVHWLGRTLALIECRGKRLLSFRYRNHETSLGAVIVRDKVLTARILEKAGVPTPKTFLVKTADEAVDATRTVQGPVVVKPRFGVKSDGVSTGLETDDEVREAFRFAKESGSQVILQPHINFTEELRIMASPEGAMAVNGRAMPHVVCDGVSTIAELIADKNRQRTLNPSLENRPIPTDALTHRQLSRLGLSVNSVPELGEHITVRNVAGLGVGGDTIQSLDETPSEIKMAAANAIAAIPGLGWGGADVIIEVGTQCPFVIEVNTQAAYGAALFPAYGEPKDVSAAAWEVRYEATASETSADPETVEPSAVPVPLVRNRNLLNAHSTIAFRRLFQDSLKRLPYPVAQQSLTVREVKTPRGRILVTRTGLTAADRFVVEKVMTRHQWVSRILALRKIPRPPSRAVTSAVQLERFLEEHPNEITLRTAETGWSGPYPYRLSLEDARKKSSVPGPSWVQSRPEGHRLRILATRQSAHVIIAHQNQEPVSRANVRAAGILAVHAVRAVPELRWAAVDVVLGSDPCEDILVEGLTTAPSSTAADQIIAGDFDDFCRWIVDADDVPITGTLSA